MSTIHHIIEGFKKYGRYSETGLFTAEIIKKWEAEFKLELPEDYKTMISAGSFDKGTFHFQELTEYSHDNAYIIFARWNENLFLFKKSDLNRAESQVYLATNDSNTEKKYDTFYDWMTMVFNTIIRPGTPE